MEPAKRIVILLIVVLLTSAPIQSADKPAATSISNTRTASCIVKITSDPLVLPLDDVTIGYLLHSSSVGGKVVREVLNISPDKVSDTFTIEALVSASGRTIPDPPGRLRPTSIGYDEQLNQNRYERNARESDTPATSTTRTRSSLTGRIPSVESRTSAEEQTILFKLQINLPQDVKPIAEEFMDALVDNLQSTLVQDFEDYKLRFQNQLEFVIQEATRAETDMRQKQKALREISGSNVLDRNTILANINRLRQQVQTAKMNQASNQVIIEATTKRIAEIEAKIKDRLKNDSITMELQGLVGMSGKLVEQAEIEVEAGRMPETQLEDLKANLARARIELARRREQLSNSAGGNLMESLNKELADSTIKAAQDEAYLANQEKQLVEADSLLIKTDDYELLSLKTDVAKQNLQEAMLWRDRMSRQIRSLQSPMVSVLGGR